VFVEQAPDRRGDAIEYWMTDVVGAPAEAMAQIQRFFSA
jgi:hypothetical protein